MRKKLTVKDCVNKCCVEAAEQNESLEEKHANRPREDHNHHLVDVDLLELSRREYL